MQELNRMGQYTRGMESLTHFAHMFGAGLRRHILLSVLLGLVFGGYSVAQALRPGQLELVPAAVGLSLTAWVAPTHVGEVTLPSGAKQRLSSVDAEAVYAAALDGRPGHFLLRQWLLRSALVALVMFALMLAGFLGYGRRLMRGKLLRGAELVDTLSWSYRTRRARQQAAVVFAVGLLTGLLVLVSRLGWAEVMRLPEYAVLWGAAQSQGLARLLSPNWDGAAIWVTYGAHQGLLAPAAAAALFGHLTVWSILGPGVGGAVLGALPTVAVLYFRHPKDAAELELGGLRLPRKREVYHLLVSGATGSGKSVAATHLLDQIRERGQRAIIFDTKGEYVEQYYRPGRDIILNPFDARSACWTPWADVRKPADYLSLGKSLFPEGGNHDKFWQVAGASLFASLCAQAQQRGYATNQQLARMLTESTLEEVKEAIAGTAGERFMADEAGAMPTNLLATLTAHLEAFRFMPDPTQGETPFSIRDFIEQPQDRWLFLVMRAEDEGAIRPLISMWYDIAINSVLALPGEDERLPQDERRRVWAFLDELARLQKLPALEGGLREGRAKGLAFVLGVQSIGDIRAAYGRDKADAMLGQPQTRLVLRTPDADTATWLERNLGRAERSRSQESQSMGADAQRDGVSIQRQVKEESVAMAAEIQKLPDLTGFLTLPTGPVYKIAYQFNPDRRREQPGFVPRPVQAPAKREALGVVEHFAAPGKIDLESIDKATGVDDNLVSTPAVAPDKDGADASVAAQSVGTTTDRTDYLDFLQV